jgi:Tol biopolymer transport system component
MHPEGRSDLHLLKLAKDFTPQGEPERLTFDRPLNYAPAWTADGFKIVFASGASWYSGQRLWELAPSRLHTRMLTLPGEPAGGLALSRQGNRFAYTIERLDGGIRRLEVSAAGLQPMRAVKFSSSTRAETEPTYSPDGKRIAFEVGPLRVSGDLGLR